MSTRQVNNEFELGYQACPSEDTHNSSKVFVRSTPWYWRLVECCFGPTLTPEEEREAGRLCDTRNALREAHGYLSSNFNGVKEPVFTGELPEGCELPSKDVADADEALEKEEFPEFGDYKEAVLDYNASCRSRASRRHARRKDGYSGFAAAVASRVRCEMNLGYSANDDTPANRMVANEKCLKVMLEHGLRRSHVPMHLPVAVELVFTPTVWESRAAMLASSKAVRMAKDVQWRGCPLPMDF